MRWLLFISILQYREGGIKVNAGGQQKQKVRKGIYK